MPKNNVELNRSTEAKCGHLFDPSCRRFSFPLPCPLVSLSLVSCELNLNIMGRRRDGQILRQVQPLLSVKPLACCLLARSIGRSGLCPRGVLHLFSILLDRGLGSIGRSGGSAANDRPGGVDTVLRLLLKSARSSSRRRATCGARARATICLSRWRSQQGSLLFVGPAAAVVPPPPEFRHGPLVRCRPSVARGRAFRPWVVRTCYIHSVARSAVVGRATTSCGAAVRDRIHN